MPERRVPEVVGERRRLGQVGDRRLGRVERTGHVAGDLGDLEAVGEAVADEVVGLRSDHLGLGGQPARGRGVHHPGAVALERGALRRDHPLRRLGDHPLAGMRVIEGVHGWHLSEAGTAT